MKDNGLAKLIEECGELTQIAAKKQAYFDTDTHPDGKGSMKERMEDEIADVLAACDLLLKHSNSTKLTLKEERRANLIFSVNGKMEKRSFIFS